MTTPPEPSPEEYAALVDGVAAQGCFALPLPEEDIYVLIATRAAGVSKVSTLALANLPECDTLPPSLVRQDAALLRAAGCVPVLVVLDNWRAMAALTSEVARA